MPPQLQTFEISHDSTIGGHNESHSGGTDGQLAPTENLQELIASHPSRMRSRAICSCSETSTISKSGSFWWLHYSAILFPRQGCDSEKCIQRRLSLRLRVAFIRFGFPIAFTASLEYVTGSHSSSIRPALTTQQIVRSTSPVFVELRKFRKGFSTFQESRDALWSLFKMDHRFWCHVDSEGHSYLWVSSHATN